MGGQVALGRECSSSPPTPTHLQCPVRTLHRVLQPLHLCLQLCQLGLLGEGLL